ncbi:MAG: hypothetical protein AB8U93_05480 [Francisella endosymbiont of Hyalomma scupense]
MLTINGFTVERALELDPTPSYNDIAQLNYNKLPEAFGCKGWLTIKIKSQTQLAQALEQARIHPKGVYIEVITDKYDYGQALNFFNSYLKGVPCINIESNTAI